MLRRPLQSAGCNVRIIIANANANHMECIVHCVQCAPHGIHETPLASDENRIPRMTYDVILLESCSRHKICALCIAIQLLTAKATVIAEFAEYIWDCFASNAKTKHISAQLWALAYRHCKRIISKTMIKYYRLSASSLIKFMIRSSGEPCGADENLNSLKLMFAKKLKITLSQNTSLM